jgi:hypothetical protein
MYIPFNWSSDLHWILFSCLTFLLTNNSYQTPRMYIYSTDIHLLFHFAHLNKNPNKWAWTSLKCWYFLFNKTTLIMNKCVLLTLLIFYDRLCGLMVRVPGYRSRDPGFDSRSYQIFWVVVGLERCPLSLVRITEELLEWKSSGSRSIEITGMGIRCPDHATPSIRKSWH